jgi:hypothetical protein
MLSHLLSRARRAVARAGGPPYTERRVVRGIPVAVTNTLEPELSSERVFARAEAVLDLVGRHQPWRLAHLRRDLAAIVVERFACRGAYFAERRACLLELTFMVNPQFTDAQVAATLVHEGVHARLDRLSARYGVTAFAEAPARHERICRRAELAFGLAVPGGEAVVERARASLALADRDVAPAIDWADAARRIEAVDRAR